jgi:predicted amidohydrolase
MIMRVGYVQTKPVFGKKKDNLDQAVELNDKTDADLLVLPELFSTGYYFPSKARLMQLAEEIPSGKTVRTFKNLARKKNCHFVFGMAEKKGSRAYNSSVYVTPHGKIYLYRKLQLFYKEATVFARGNLKPKVFPFYEYKLGMMICFDYMFPEICRVMALAGADLICHPSNLVLEYCQLANRTRSLENRVFIIMSNRVGEDTAFGETLKFTGMSQITSPDGSVLARGPKTKPALSVTDIDMQDSREKKPTPYNHVLNDRRPGFYRDLL